MNVAQQNMPWNLYRFRLSCSRLNEKYIRKCLYCMGYSLIHYLSSSVNKFHLTYLHLFILS